MKHPSQDRTGVVAEAVAVVAAVVVAVAVAVIAADIGHLQRTDRPFRGQISRERLPGNPNTFGRRSKSRRRGECGRTNFMGS